MKQLLTLCLSLAVVQAFAQGTVLFNNRFSPAYIDAPISYGAGGPAPAGRIDGRLAIASGGYVWGGVNAAAGLYAGPAGATEDDLFLLTPIASFRSGTFAGYVNVDAFGTRWVPGIPTGAPATFQIRAWDAGVPGIASYEQAATLGETRFVYLGRSPLVQVTALGGDNLPYPPLVPASLVGLQGFALIGEPAFLAPEPACIVLVILGALLIPFAPRRD